MKNKIRKTKLFKTSMFLISLLLILVTYFSCNMYKIISHEGKVDEYLPETFRMETPLIVDHKGYFCITAQVNSSYNMEFIIDTKATCLAKKDDIEKLNANYYGKFPIALENAYGQKQKLALYSFDKFEIQSLTFNEPLFYCVPKTNYLYDMMYKNVLGINILKHLFWKFSMDDNKVILFSSKDTILQKKETEGFIKIENGLRQNNIMLSLPNLEKQKNFTLDLGFLGEISIDKKCFEQLSKQLPYQRILTARASTIDTTYVFEKTEIKLDNISIPNCQIVYIPKMNKNLIGAKFMYRFNFILGYDYYTSKISHDDLYLKPIESFYDFKSTPYVSNFGFSIDKKENNIIILNMEIGSIAEQVNLKIGDKVLCVDSIDFRIGNEISNKDLLLYVSDKKHIIMNVERDGKELFLRLEKD